MCSGADSNPDFLPPRHKVHPGVSAHPSFVEWMNLRSYGISGIRGSVVTKKKMPSGTPMYPPRTEELQMKVCFSRRSVRRQYGIVCPG